MLSLLNIFYVHSFVDRWGEKNDEQKKLKIQDLFQSFLRRGEG